MMMKRGMVLTAVLLAALLVVPSAFAAGDGDDGWKFDLAPFYLWALTLDGDVGIGPIEQSLAVDFGDIWDNLEAVVTGHFEARKGGWGGIIDVSYLNLAPEKTLSNGVTVGADLKVTMVELDGFYSIVRDAHVFDILAGFRYSGQDTGIDITPPGLSGSVDADWWDPIVGGRWIWGFTPKWQLSARGDIGGFGVGCDFTWNASALVLWQPWKHVALAAGYRALDQDYEDGEGRDHYAWDATMHGPIAGINFRW
jgi:hypothetical protein